MICGAAVGMALLHAAFAFYLQRRVISGLKSNSELVQDVGRIILYDVGFCLYAFAFLGCFGFCFYAFFALLFSCGGGLGYAALGLLLLFHCVAPGYGMLWYCGQCCGQCCGARLQSSESTGPPPQPVGAQA